MSAKNGNILALFHDGHYLAEIAGGIRAAHQDGRKADFKNGNPEGEKLQAAYLHDDMEEMRQKVEDALSATLPTI